MNCAQPVWVSAVSGFVWSLALFVFAVSVFSSTGQSTESDPPETSTNSNPGSPGETSETGADLISKSVDYLSLLEILENPERELVERRLVSYSLLDWNRKLRSGGPIDWSAASDKDRAAWDRLPQVWLDLLQRSGDDWSLRSLALSGLMAIPESLEQVKSSLAALLKEQMDSRLSSEKQDVSQRMFVTNAVQSLWSICDNESGDDLPLAGLWESWVLDNDPTAPGLEIAETALRSNNDWISAGRELDWLARVANESLSAERRLESAKYWLRSMRDFNQREKHLVQWLTSNSPTYPATIRRLAKDRILSDGWHLPESGGELKAAWMSALNQSSPERAKELQDALLAPAADAALDALSSETLTLIFDQQTERDVRLTLAKLAKVAFPNDLASWTEMALDPATDSELRFQILQNLQYWIQESKDSLELVSLPMEEAKAEEWLSIWNTYLESEAPKENERNLAVELWFQGLKKDLQTSGSKSHQDLMVYLRWWTKSWEPLKNSLSQDPDSTAATNSVSSWIPEALDELERVARKRYFERWTSALKRNLIWIAPLMILLVSVIGVALFVGYLLWKKPLVLLEIKIIGSDKTAGGYSWLKKIPIPQRWLKSDRVLKLWRDAVLSSEGPSKLPNFKMAPVSVGVRAESRDWNASLIQELIENSASFTMTRLSGPALSGKSALLLEVYHWLKSAEAESKGVSVIPVLLDGLDQEKDWNPSFAKTVSLAIRRTYPTSLAHASESWIMEMVRAGRIWVGLDHWQDEIVEQALGWDKQWGTEGWSGLWLTLDRHHHQQLSTSLEKSMDIEMLPLEVDQVGPYLEQSLRNRGFAHLLDQAFFYDSLKSFISLLETGKTTMETACMALDWLIFHGQQSEENPVEFPESQLDLALWWAGNSNTTVKNKRLTDDALERVGAAIAWESVRRHYKLEPVKKLDLYTSLASESQVSAKIDYLHRKLGWLVSSGPEDRWLTWRYESLAYWLAAGRAFQVNGVDLTRWEEFLQKWTKGTGSSTTASTVHQRDPIACALYETAIGWSVDSSQEEHLPETVELELARRAGVNADKALRALRRRRLNLLLDQLLDIETNDRLPLLKTLVELGPDSKSATTRLAKVALDLKEDLELRQAALEALSSIGAYAAAAAEDLGRAIQNSEEHLFFRLKMTEALGNIGEKAFKTVPALIQVLNQDSTQAFFKYQILEALGKIGPAAHEALGVVQRLKLSDQPELREAAAWALQSIRGSSPAPLRPVRELGADDGQGLIKSGLNTMDSVGKWLQLAKSFRDPETLDREKVFQRLSEGGEDAQAAVPELVKILRDKEADMEGRQLALDALAALKSKASEAAGPLVKLAMDPDEMIFYRIKAVETLGALGAKALDAASALRSVCINSREQIFFRSRIIQCLAGTGPEGKLLVESWRSEISASDLESGLALAFGTESATQE